MDITAQLAFVGVTQEELQSRVVDKIADEMLKCIWSDDEGNPVHRNSPLRNELQEAVRSRVDEKIEQLAHKLVGENFDQYLANIVLSPTSAWGENKGQPLTFGEYVTQQAKEYLSEPVDDSGKTAKHSRWNNDGTMTRADFLVRKQVERTVQNAVSTASVEAQKYFREVVQDAVHIALEKVASAYEGQRMSISVPKGTKSSKPTPQRKGDTEDEE